MEALARDAEAYVRQAFGWDLDLHRLEPAALPHFVVDQYSFWAGSLLGQPMILMAANEQRPGTGGDQEKHRDIVRKRFGVQLVVMLLRKLPSVIRRQMVERRIAFLSPGAQLYIPEALLDLRERTGTELPPSGDQISPTAQTILLASLLGAAVDDENLTQLADRFHISIMSVSRAVDELEKLDIARPHHIGRQRRLRLALREGALWHAIEARLQSPVRKVRLARSRLPVEGMPLAGESALAQYTMLAAPRVERRAVPAFAWRRIAEEFRMEPATRYDEDRIEVETWTYDPYVLKDIGINGGLSPAVDRLSLHLSIRNDPDERVAQAAQQLLEFFPW